MGEAGNQSFGHLGFTGTSIWIDPNTGAGKSQMAERLIPASPHLTKKTPKKESNLLQKGKEAG